MLRKLAFYAFFLIVFYCVTIHSARAQKEYIVVEKTLSSKQIRYKSGDKISYKLEGEDFFRTDHIVALNDTAIEFHYNQILYHEISQINIRGKRFSGINLKKIGIASQIAGIGYIAIDQFNQVVVRGEEASFNEDVWIAGGILFAAGTMLRMLAPKKIRLGGKYRIRYMNLNYK